MGKLFTRLTENNFSELTGLTVAASVPVREGLINELVQSELTGNKTITSCHLTIHRDNRVIVDLRTSIWPLPLSLKLRLFRAVDLSHSPRVRAFLENHIFLGKLAALFKALPPGITLYDDQLTVDLGPFIAPEFEKFLPLVRSVDIRTEENQLILDIKIER